MHSCRQISIRYEKIARSTFNIYFKDVIFTEKKVGEYSLFRPSLYYFMPNWNRFHERCGKLSTWQLPWTP